MRVAIASVQVPFIRGGAELSAAELTHALTRRGVRVEQISLPFRFGPPAEVRRSMNAWDAEYFDRFDCGHIDHVFCLKFPAFYLQHDRKTVWLMHQHRSVYELFDTPFGESSANWAAVELREEVIRRDTDALNSSRAIYTTSKRVSERMAQYNGVRSASLSQPPPDFERFYESDQLSYIYFPSRLETLKRQALLVQAMAHVRSPVAAIISGDGGMRSAVEMLIAELGVESKVKLLGHIGRDEMLAWYANALGVFFGPYDEDYGFITLEAMLSSKPVITCTDSGGPLEFVIDGQTGYVTDPAPEAVAEAIDRLWADRANARRLGRNGRARYSDLDISWDHVVNTLLG